MLIYSPSLGRDIDSTDVTSEEHEALLRDFNAPEASFMAPGIQREVLAVLRREANYRSVADDEYSHGFEGWDD